MKTLFIPIEIASRELDGKLLLALMAAERGMEVILGRRQDVDRPGLGRGIYLAKNVRGSFILDRPQAMGHAIVALDEEGLVRFPDHVQSMRIEDRSITLPRILYAWGDDNADYWRRLPAYDGRPIETVGNPRADLLRPELRAVHQEEAEALRRRYGPFVLLNTNFSIVNHFWHGHTSFKRAADADTETFARIWEGLKAHKLALFDAFQALIGPLSQALAPTHRLIVRPHPSEDQAAWKAAAARYPNVEVVIEGSVVPWLLASSGLVQNGCTTAIEAAMLDVPTVTYRPIRSDDYDLPLPNQFGLEVSTASQAADAAKAMAKEASAVLEPRDARYAKLRPHISSVSGAFSCERILDSFTEHRELLEQRVPVPASTQIKALGRLIADLVADKSFEHRYNKHIFPPLTRNILSSRITRFETALARFTRVRLSSLSRNVFKLESV